MAEREPKSCEFCGRVAYWKQHYSAKSGQLASKEKENVRLRRELKYEEGLKGTTQIGLSPKQYREISAEQMKQIKELEKGVNQIASKMAYEQAEKEKAWKENAALRKERDEAQNKGYIAGIEVGSQTRRCLEKERDEVREELGEARMNNDVLAGYCKRFEAKIEKAKKIGKKMWGQGVSNQEVREKMLKALEGIN